MSAIPRLSILSAILEFEAGKYTFLELHTHLESIVGPIDPFLMGQLWALMVQLIDLAGEPHDLVSFLDAEIDQTLNDLLPRKVTHHV